MMKNKILTGISAIMALIPWTILPLRAHFQWALDYAHIMIPCYAVFIFLSGVFTILSYVKAKAQNNFMKVCLIVNSLYAVSDPIKAQNRLDSNKLFIRCFF